MERTKPVNALVLPPDVFLLKNDDFYSFIRGTVGETFESYLKFLSINSAECLFETITEIYRSHQVTHAFGSEDCTGVVKTINYDVKTDSFVGFASPLQEGVPFTTYFQTDSFEELKKWFN